MMTQKDRDKNLLVVAAVEIYAQRHNMAARDVFTLFAKNDIANLIRSQYEALHTQSLDESASFAEDVLSRTSG
jgi:hypothetical protein